MAGPTAHVLGLLSAYKTQRIHNASDPKRSSIDTLLASCEAIIRGYDVACERRAKEALLSNVPKGRKRALSKTTPVVDKDGFVTIVRKKGKSVAASLGSVPNPATSRSEGCLFTSYYNPSNVSLESEAQAAKGPAPIPNFYKFSRKQKHWEGLCLYLFCRCSPAARAIQGRSQAHCRPAENALGAPVI